MKFEWQHRPTWYIAQKMLNSLYTLQRNMRCQLSHPYETTNKIVSSVNFYLYTYQKQMGKDSGPNIIQQHPPLTKFNFLLFPPWKWFWFASVVPSYITLPHFQRFLLLVFVIIFSCILFMRNEHIHCFSVFTSPPMPLLPTIRVSVFFFIVHTCSAKKWLSAAQGIIYVYAPQLT